MIHDQGKYGSSVGASFATGLDHARLQRRVTGRRAATELLAMCQELQPSDPEALLAFWEQVHEFSGLQLPSASAVDPEQDHIGPMSASEVVAYEDSIVQFGQYRGVYVRAVPLKYLDYVVGLPGDQVWKSQIVRYLKNPQVAARLEQELGE